MKNNYKRTFKIFAVLFLIVFLTSFTNNTIFAKINEQYAENTASVDLDSNEIIKSSQVLNLMGAFIYAIGNLAESISSGLMSLLTGDKTFPWADKIIFNTIPILDVNFINPDDRSFLSLNSSIGIGQVVRNIYFTGLSLALGFLGIIIAVMAIKLAISTIASDKAKYKEAITKWLTAIILLFSMHFVLSFLFYMNEKMVEVASQILENVIQNSSVTAQKAITNTLNQNKQRVVLNFCNKAIESAAWAEAYSWTNPIGWTVNGIRFIWDTATGNKDNDQNAQVAQKNVEYLYENYEITYALINNSAMKEYALSYIGGNSENNWLENIGTSIGGSIAGMFGYSAAETEIGFMKKQVEYIKNGIDDATFNATMQNAKNMEAKGKDSTEYKAAQLVKVVATYANQYRNGTFNSNNGMKKIIAELGEYFKTTAWYTDIENGGWSPTEASIVSATLYTMLVFQSIMFFMAYFKRFFYVVILSVIAPFVVIYDFFTKSLSL